MNPIKKLIQRDLKGDHQLFHCKGSRGLALIREWEMIYWLIKKNINSNDLHELVTQMNDLIEDFPAN